MKRHLKHLALFAGIGLFFSSCATRPPAIPEHITERVPERVPDYFTDWPAGSSPQEIGKRLAENFVVRRQEGPTVHYKEVCAWYGSLTFAQLTKDADLKSRLIKKFEPILTIQSNSIPLRQIVDDHIFGALPLEIYIQNGNTNCLALGRRFADEQWAKTTPDGISVEARYWADDMYMITMVQLQAFRATHDAKYLDRSALAMATYLDRLQQTNGLFYHRTNAPFYWGRGNGWFAAGMTEMLRSLPKNHPQRARILKGYQTMLAALLKYQGDDGLWRQLIDDPEAWPETSSTGMFAFAMVTGVKNGWLDGKTFGPASRKAWLGLVSYLEPDGRLRNVSTWVGEGNSADYYLNRQRLIGDLHGQAPFLWTASALLR